MTNLTNSYFERTMRAACRVTHITDGVPHEMQRTNSEQTGGPRNTSLESMCIGLN